MKIIINILIVIVAYVTLQHETTVFSRCLSQVLSYRSNVVRKRMTIKSSDGYSTNIVDGH